MSATSRLPVQLRCVFRPRSVRASRNATASPQKVFLLQWEHVSVQQVLIMKAPSAGSTLLGDGGFPAFQIATLLPFFKVKP